MWKHALMFCQQHMVNCFPPGHQPHDPPPDLLSLVASTLDKMTRNTFQPALATQTTLLQSVALDHAKPLPRDPAAASSKVAAGPVEMHLDQSKVGRARLNSRKKALAGRRDGMDVRVLGVDAESRGGVGLSEEIRGALDDEFGGEDAGFEERSLSEEDEDVPVPLTQAFGQSSLQVKMQSRSGSRGLFEADSGAVVAAEQPFRCGEEDRLDGSSFRIATIKTTIPDGTDEAGDDRGVKRRKCVAAAADGACGIESALGARFGLGRDHVRARVERGLAGRPSLWEAASGL